MTILTNILTGALIGLAFAGIARLGLGIEDAQLKAGKSPHNGFCPQSTTWAPSCAPNQKTNIQ